jgi:acyl-CoA thioester hydrolase
MTGTMTTILPAAPFLSSSIAIDQKWIDYNGHLNQAYYSLIFDIGIEEVIQLAGLGIGYIKLRNCSTMTVESHLCFVREVFEHDPVRVSVQVLGADDKRMHLYCEIRHATEGWLSCTSEWMSLHVNLETRRVAPWPSDVRARLDAMVAASAPLPRPERAGRAIAMARKPALTTPT